ncbi:MAG TPA: sugar transferase, partial [Thermomicrobiales bacterium]|nr:sugar transferase [Thermomicrobiales bacterium]
VGVAAALALATALRYAVPAGRPLIPERNYLSVGLFPLALACWALAAGHFRLYEWHWVMNLRHEAARLLLATGGAMILVSGALYLTYREVPRLLFVYFAVLVLVVNGAIRLLLRLFFRTRLGDLLAVRIVLVGGGRVADSLAGRLRAEAGRWPPLHVAGVVADDPPAAASLRHLGALADLERVIADHGITTVIVTLPSSEHARIVALTERLQALPVDVRVVPDVLDLAYARATITHVEGIPLVGLRDPALSASGKLVKYSFDRLIGLAGLLLGWPLALVVAAAIRLDSPGPVFYRAARIGEDGRPFTMYKFRTMVADADRHARAKGPTKTHDDPRITRVGRWLRRTSVDELPQIWNVLRGEMSLVGPRPEQPFIVAGYEPWQRRRTHIRPGMTGWWQVNGRSEHPMHRHTDFDLYYLENYSLLLDLRILGRTLGAVITGRGAY